MHIVWFTSRGRNDFINELRFGALPELLDDHLQLLILLVDGTWKANKSFRSNGTLTPQSELLTYVCVSGQTFCLDLEWGAHKSEQSSVEGDCPIRVQRDVHSDQSLRGQEGGAGGVRSVCLLTFLVSNCAEFFFTYLASNTMRTQFSKTERWLNPAQHRDNIDVFYTTAARGEEQHHS